MSNSYPSILKNSVFLYIRLFITLLVSLYSSRVLLDVLGVEDFGIYNVVAGFVILAMFFRNTLVDAIQRYMTIAVGRNDIVEFNKVFCTSINVSIIISIVLLLCFFSIGLWFVYTQLVYPVEKTTDVLCVYSMSCISFIIGVLFSAYMAAIVAYERMDVYAYIGIINVILKLAVVLLLKYCFSGQNNLIAYSILISVVTLFEAVVTYFYALYTTTGTRYRLYFNKNLFYSMIRFSGWNMIASGSILLISQGSNILLNIFGGPVVNAANGIAYQVMGAVRQFSSSFQNATNPRITKYYAQRDITNMLNLCLTASKMSFLLFFIISIPLVFHIDYILDLWLVEVPNYASLFCILVLSTALFEALGYPIITAIRAVGDLKGYQIWVSSILIMAVPISYIFLKLGFSFYVVYIINLVLTVVASITRIAYLYKLIKFNIKSFYIKLYTPILYVSFLSISVCCIVMRLIPNKPIITILLTGFITCMFIYIVGLSKQERTKIFLLWKRKNVY